MGVPSWHVAHRWGTCAPWATRRNSGRARPDSPAQSASPRRTTRHGGPAALRGLWTLGCRRTWTWLGTCMSQRTTSHLCLRLKRACRGCWRGLVARASCRYKRLPAHPEHRAPRCPAFGVAPQTQGGCVDWAQRLRRISPRSRVKQMPHERPVQGKEASGAEICVVQAHPEVRDPNPARGGCVMLERHKIDNLPCP